MVAYSRFKAAVNMVFRGASDNSAPCLRPVPATLARPEGERRYLLAAPEGAPAGKRALVVVLHGAGATPEQVLGMAYPASPLSVWLAIGQREGLVVIAPDAGKGGWSDGFASAAKAARKNDVAFVETLIDLAIHQHDVDPARVHVIGVSRGGLMACRLAVEIGHRLAAFSSVLAGMPAPGQSRMPERPLPALFFGGTLDPLIPYHGGKTWRTLGMIGPVSSIEDSAQCWRKLAGLPDMPEVTPIASHHAWDTTRVTRSIWGDNPAGPQVGVFRIHGGGHAEPSALKRYPGFINKLVGRQNADIEVAEAAWEFFRDKRARS